MTLSKIKETKKVFVDHGIESTVETLVVQIGEGHQLCLVTCDGLLFCYKFELLPGISFKPLELADLVAQHYLNLKTEKAKKP